MSAAPTVDCESEHVSLSAYLGRVRDALREIAGGPTWVVAEVTEAKLHRNGHLYLTLGELNEQGSLVAEARAVAFSVARRTWWREFQQDIGTVPEAGMKVLIQVVAELDVRYGFSLKVQAIDPSFTLGEFTRKIAKICAELRAEGILERQQAFRGPVDFTRIALIAPEGAAGLGDVRADLDRLVDAGLLQVDLHFATFQGAGAEASVIEALRAVYKAHGQSPYDALGILRGGGSTADLDALNRHALARAVCLMPLPVFVAIGHERDRSVLDEVAHRSFDTPSKLAGHIRHTIVDRARTAAANLQRIGVLAARLIDGAQRSTDLRIQHAAAAAQGRCLAAAHGAERALARTRAQAQGMLERARQIAERSWSSATGATRIRLERLHQQQQQRYAQSIQLMQATAARAQDRAGHWLEAIASDARRKLVQAGQALNLPWQQAGQAARRALSRTDQALQHAWEMADARSPQRILARGYLLARDADAQIIRTPEQLDGVVQFTFATGSVRRRVSPEE